jgi:hypothetical protein
VKSGLPVLPDLKHQTVEELEKLLSFLKESAWKVEREIMEKKMSSSTIN